MSGGDNTPGHGGAFVEARARVLQRLRSRRSEIDQAILTRVRDGVVDPAQGDDVDYLNGLQAAAVAAVDYVLLGIERGGGTPQPIPSPVLTQARRAARTGVGLDTALRRYVAGYALLEDFIMREAEHDQAFVQGKVLRGILASAASLVDNLVTAVADAYRNQLQWDTGASLRAAAIGTPHLPVPAASSTSPRPSPPIVGPQRARILQAIVQIVSERGYAGASVALVSTRAKVSRTTFYEQFSSVDEGLVAIMESTLEQVGALVSRAFEGQNCWHDGMRLGLAAVLTFFDSEPELARVCLVESLAGGANLLEQRARILAAFRALVLAHLESEVSHASPMVAEGVLASVMGIVHARLTAREPHSLIALLGPLMGTIVAPFSDQQTVQCETHRAERLASEIQSRAVPSSPLVTDADHEDLAQTHLPIPDSPLTRRAWECLLFLADQGGRGLNPSNRQVALGIGVAHQSHISRLLSYLLQEGLVTKSSEGPGKRNAWNLTSVGEEMVRSLSPQT